jgi:hypothetical protein
MCYHCLVLKDHLRYLQAESHNVMHLVFCCCVASNLRRTCSAHSGKQLTHPGFERQVMCLYLLMCGIQADLMPHVRPNCLTNAQETLHPPSHSLKIAPDGNHALQVPGLLPQHTEPSMSCLRSPHTLCHLPITYHSRKPKCKRIRVGTFPSCSRALEARNPQCTARGGI